MQNLRNGLFVFLTLLSAFAILLGSTHEGSANPVNSNTVNVEDATIGVQNDDTEECNNDLTGETEDCEEDCEEFCFDTISSTGAGGTFDVANGTITNTPFGTFDNNSYNFFHKAYDYDSGSAQPAGCSSCGGSASQNSDLLSLKIERVHRYRNLVEGGSFGPGTFCNNDTKAKIYEVDGGLQLDIFDPREVKFRRLFDGQGGDASLDGQFTDVINNKLAGAEVLDSSGNPTSTLSSAKTIKIEAHNGMVHRFEVVDVTGSSTPPADDLVGYWDFDGQNANDNAPDDSNPDNGTVSSASFVTNDRTQTGYAIDFTGSSGSRVLIPNNTELEVGSSNANFTVALWIKLQATHTGNLRCIAHKGNSTSDCTFQLLMDDDSNSICYQVTTGGGVEGGISNTALTVGQWTHVTVVKYEDTLRLYINGRVDHMTTLEDDVVSNTGSLYLGDDLNYEGTDCQIDDVCVYNRNLLEGDVLAISCQTELAGRLVEIADPKSPSNKIELEYKYDPDDPADAAIIAAAPDKQWQIDTATDAAGREATFTYKTTQEFGLWVIEKIDLPNGQDIDYIYDSGRISEIDHPDGTESTFAYEESEGFFKVAFNDVAAKGPGRVKEAYLTNNITMHFHGDETPWGDLYNQSAMMVRMVAAGPKPESGTDDREVVYMIMNGSHYLGNDRAVYEGGGKLRFIVGFQRMPYYKDGWTFGDMTNGFGAINGTLEDVYAKSEHWSSTARNKGTYNHTYDEGGSYYEYQYDGSHPTVKTYTDGTTETWAYNELKKITRYKDRDDRVTKYFYSDKDTTGDNNGPLLIKKQVGILDTGTVATPNDVNQAEFAEYVWEYYGSSETVESVVQPEGFLKKAYTASATAGTNGPGWKRYVYNAGNQLWRVYEVDDTGTSDHLAQEFLYDAAKRLQYSREYYGASSYREVTYQYDARDRVQKITYADSSTEEFVYGTGTDANLLILKKDRGGTVTQYVYDDLGRRTEVIVGIDEDQSSILSSYSLPDPELTDIHKTTYTYINGTTLPETVTSNGETTTYKYDYRHRLVESSVQPKVGQTLTTKKTYVDNRLFCTEDPYGRKTYYGYRAADGKLFRIVKGLVPEFSLADFAAVENLTRSTADFNPQYVVTDSLPNNSGQHVEVIDPRGIVQATQLDSRSRPVYSVAAAAKLGVDSYEGGEIAENGFNVGTLPADAAITQTVYDANSNVKEVYSPRYFDSGDTNGYNKAYETWTYTNRNLRATHTVDPAGTPATEEWTYNGDRTVATREDFRQKTWTTLWHTCCKHPAAQIDPYNHGTLTRYDSRGNVIHTAQVKNLATEGSWDNPTDANTLSETTTRYDKFNRPIARTVWMSPLSSVFDSSNPPIATDGTSGLTTRWFYDNDLTDEKGLDGTGGNKVVMTRIQDGETMNLSLRDIDANLTTLVWSGFTIPYIIDIPKQLGTDPATGNTITGSAVMTVNPEDEISFTLRDGAGRTVVRGVPHQDVQNHLLDGAISFNLTQYDELIDYGPNTLLATTYYDAADIDNMLSFNYTYSRKTVADAAGSVKRIYKADESQAMYRFDANGNPVWHTYSGVGWNAGDAAGEYDGYDNHNRLTVRRDTYGDVTQTAYDASGNVTTSTDAKDNDTTFAYDARSRKVSMTDRLSGVTTWAYDANGNLEELCDADNQGGTPKPTVYTYDDANRKLTEAYPGHASETIGHADYDKKTFTYNEAGRLDVVTDQQGDNVTHNFDLAGRLTSRDYENAAQTVTDTDSFTYDDASRMLTAISDRYTNTVSLVYDEAGRKSSESLAVNFGTARTYTVGSDYNNVNLRTQITYPDDIINNHSSYVDRSYNNLDQIQEINYNGTYIANYAYDDRGRRELRITADGNTTEWDYRTGDDQVASIEITDYEGSLFGNNFAYTYDANKNKLTETISGTMSNYGFNSTTYDDEDRLTAWSRPDSFSQSWSLSAAGDWNTFADNSSPVSRTHNGVHELTAVGATSVVHDAKGNLTTNSNGQTYTWDFDNRMASATVGANTHTYGYDALGRRVSKTVMTDGGTGGEATATTVFVYDGQQVLAEYNSITNPSVSGPVRTYVYATYIDEPVMMIDSQEDYHYYHQNSLYNVVALVGEFGIERYSYTAYGKPTFHNTDGTVKQDQVSSSANPYLYTGRRYDPETGLYYYRARYYDSDLGRFIGRDPIGYDGSKWNLYEYVRSSPLTNRDPSGMKDEKEPIAIGGSVSVDIGTGTVGEPVISTIAGCAAPCVMIHEAIHYQQFTDSSYPAGECFKKASEAYEAATSLKEKEAIEKKWNDYHAAAEPWIECPAYAAGLLCMDALYLIWDCSNVPEEPEQPGFPPEDSDEYKEKCNAWTDWYQQKSCCETLDLAIPTQGTKLKEFCEPSLGNPWPKCPF